MPNIPLTLDEWLVLALRGLGAIVGNYRRSVYKTPRTLDETYLEASYELARWYSQWREEGRTQPKWTPASSAKFAWQHALEKVHAIMGGVMRTPAALPRHGPERWKYQSTTPPEDMPYGEMFAASERLEEEIEAAELEEAIMDAIQEMPPHLAEAVYLHHIKGLNSVEIGRRLGVSREVARNRILSGTRQLQQLLTSFIEFTE